MSGTEAMLCALAQVVTQGDFTVPPYPAVALRLRRVLENDRHGAADIVNVIATDPALAATVLAAANSALFGNGSAITSLPAAVGRLGARTIGALAIVSGMGTTAVAAGVLFDVKLAGWQRTMTCALICQKLSSARGLVAEESFLAGLLHGFGRSIAIASIERLVKTTPPAQPLTAEEWLAIAEQQRGVLARAVARAWELPAPIADAIDTKDRGGSVLGDLVLDADGIGTELLAGRVPAPAFPTEAKLLEELLSALPSALQALAAPVASPPPKRTLSSAKVLEKPQHALTGDLRPTSVAVVDRRSKTASTLTCRSVGPLGIEIDSSRPFQECAIVRLTIGWGGVELEVWFTVVLCVQSGQLYRVELQLFCPTTDIRAKWAALHDSVAASSSSQRVQAG
jgi:HD-like signal output (HDOD) protein